VILDILLARRGAPDVALARRRQGLRRADPGHRRQQLRRRAQGPVARADAYLAKPVRREVLLEKLEAFARADGTRRMSRSSSTTTPRRAT
jgi:hypothetical protein